MNQSTILWVSVKWQMSLLKANHVAKIKRGWGGSK